jgi:hypothetical protein
MYSSTFHCQVTKHWQVYSCQHCKVMYIAMSSIKLNVNCIVLCVAGLVSVTVALVYSALQEMFYMYRELLIFVSERWVYFNYICYLLHVKKLTNFREAPCRLRMCPFQQPQLHLLMCRQPSVIGYCLQNTGMCCINCYLS